MNPAFQDANHWIDSIQLGGGGTFDIFRHDYKIIDGNQPSLCPNFDFPKEQQDRQALLHFLPGIEEGLRKRGLIKEGQTIHWVGRQRTLATICRCAPPAGKRGNPQSSTQMPATDADTEAVSGNNESFPKLIGSTQRPTVRFTWHSGFCPWPTSVIVNGGVTEVGPLGGGKSREDALPGDLMAATKIALAYLKMAHDLINPTYANCSTQLEQYTKEILTQRGAEVVGALRNTFREARKSDDLVQIVPFVR
jgi:hypothetical protein